MLGDPLRGVLIRALYVVLEIVPAYAVGAAATNLDVPQVAATDERVDLGFADVQLLGDLGAGEKRPGMRLRLGRSADHWGGIHSRHRARVAATPVAVSQPAYMSVQRIRLA